MKDYLYHYRIREFSNSHIRNEEAHFERLNVELDKLRFYQDNGLFEIYYEDIRNQFLKNFYCNTLHIIFCKFDNIPLKLIYEMQSIVRKIFSDYLKFCEDCEDLCYLVMTVAFDFPSDIWEDYKKAYLNWLQKGETEEIVRFYLRMKKSLEIVDKEIRL